MINLPVLRELSVKDYGLYPGTSSAPGLIAELSPGLTLILGANGLGKTTLITILFRMLSGPYDIANIASGRELGNRKLDAANLARSERRIFSVRVNDDAAAATASLQFELGDSIIELTRSLSDLALLSISVNNVAEESMSEASYQKVICENGRLATFGDWILVLRHLVFYFEDRRELVWDASAQRELLRLLFLSTDDTREWTQKSRTILERDSLVRNLGYAFRKEERMLAKVEQSVGSAGEVRQQLKLLQQLQEQEQQRLEQLDGSLIAIESDRQRARVSALEAEQAHESAMRAVEQHQLSAIATSFPSATETARYLISQILSDQECLACGSQVPSYSDELAKRVREHACVVCGSAIETPATASENVKTLLAQAVKKLEASETRKFAAEAERTAAEAAYTDLLSELSKLNSSTATRSERIGELIKMLPPDEQSVHEQRADLVRIRARYETLDYELTKMRTDFATFVSSVNQKIAEQKEQIKETFESLAGGFLFEDCTLVWAPRKARMGESGELIEFAAFELEMTGGDFQTAVRRSGPQQVSESQREFIDLAFRMALMSAASRSGASLVIDAPESSLDAVFVGRAADVLTRFANLNVSNRLVVTSNLIDGDLIPELLYKNGINSSEDDRVVDLLRIATPTAATKRWHTEYESVRSRLFERARGLGDG